MSRSCPGLAQKWSEQEAKDRQEDYRQQPEEEENKELGRGSSKEWVKNREGKEKSLRFKIYMATRMNMENQRSSYNNGK